MFRLSDLGQFFQYIYNRSVESNVVRKKILLSSSSLTFLVLEVVCLRNTRDCVFEFRSEKTEMFLIILRCCLVRRNASELFDIFLVLKYNFI